MRTATLTITRDHLDEVQPGDRLVAIDDVTLSFKRVFTDGPQRLWPNGPIGIPFEYGRAATGYLYPDSLVEHSITVERAEPEPTPAPARLRRPVTRTIDGMRLVSQGDSVWRTEDGRYEVRLGYDGLTFCEGPHPVRITWEMRQWAQANTTRSDAQPILTAIALGKRGYLCEGEVEHQSPDAWQVWDLSGSNVDPFEDTRFDSFTEAVKALARHLQKKG